MEATRLSTKIIRRVLRLSSWMDPMAESELFVNLRCMEIQENKCRLHVGCGILSDSDAEAEYRETEMKAATLGKMIY